MSIRYMEVSPIYTVCVMFRGERDRVESVLRSRTWGWYAQFEVAEDVVLRNTTDIFECGYYNLGLIEEVPQGILVTPSNRWWFKGEFVEGPDNETRVTRIPDPDWAENIINFSMG